MNQIAQLSFHERRALFTETGARLGLPPFHVEKDFWVCWVLATFFSDPVGGPHLTFRGGTSLSKAWGIIERFFLTVCFSRSVHYGSDPRVIKGISFLLFVLFSGLLIQDGCWINGLIPQQT